MSTGKQEDSIVVKWFPGESDGVDGSGITPSDIPKRSLTASEGSITSPVYVQQTIRYSDIITYDPTLFPVLSGLAFGPEILMPSGSLLIGFSWTVTEAFNDFDGSSGGIGVTKNGSYQVFSDETVDLTHVNSRAYSDPVVYTSYSEQPAWQYNPTPQGGYLVPSLETHPIEGYPFFYEENGNIRLIISGWAGDATTGRVVILFNVARPN